MYKKIFKYSRPVEQMVIAIVYGDLEDIFDMMDDNKLQEAINEIVKKVKEDDWDLHHYPNKSGLGGKLILKWKE